MATQQQQSQQQRGGGGGGGGGNNRRAGNNNNNSNRSSQQQRSSGRRGGRGGGGGGNNNDGSSNADSGGGGGGGRRRQQQQPRHRNQQQRQQHQQQQSSSSNADQGMRDEDILIAFMPYLKGSHAEATRIHEDYQSTNDQRTFLSKAREFVKRQQTAEGGGAAVAAGTSPAKASSNAAASPSSSSHPSSATNDNIISPPSSTTTPHPSTTTADSASSSTINHSILPPGMMHQQMLPSPVATTTASSLFSSPGHHQHPNPTTTTTSSTTPYPPPAQQVAIHRPDPPGEKQQQRQHITTAPERATAAAPPTTQQQQLPSPHHHLQPNNHAAAAAAAAAGPTMESLERAMGGLLQDNNNDPILSFGSSALAAVVPPQPTTLISTTQLPNATASGGQPLTPPPGVPAPVAADQSRLGTPAKAPPPTTPSAAATPDATAAGTPATTKPAADKPAKREAPMPKRIWTRFREQPGRLSVDRFSGEDPRIVIGVGPKQEIMANWSLPVQYLQKRFDEAHAGTGATKKADSLERLLNGLTVGLFRRGGMENSSQASIISKAAMGDTKRFEYWKTNQGVVCGRVPFFSPRTPGHVLFRLYWEKQPVYTLATGPTLLVRVLECDYENSVRFILSNFKGRRANPTSLSSLNTLATLLETQITRPNDSAARATWGCVQESRKVIELCADEYVKTSRKLGEVEETVNELKVQLGEDDDESKPQSSDGVFQHPTPHKHHGNDDGGGDEDDDRDPELVALLRDKMRELMGGRASNERKWRDSQLAFAGILKAVVLNPTMSIMMRRDLISRMTLEHQLWCSLSEQFASPVEDRMWFESIKKLPSVVTADHFNQYAQVRRTMQIKNLGFDPNTHPLDDVLFPRGPANQRTTDTNAVSVFNNTSASMGQYYQNLFAEEERVVRCREMIRQRTEKCVQECGAYPPGTTVAIFGSSANGFGSPKSDIDMCLQIPDGATAASDEDEEDGSTKMSKLADQLGESGMKDVDTSRLTARIPIIRYYCPDPLSPLTENGDPPLIECDLAMHNPLAVLNTHLLRTYAEITPVTRVLASIIKRWAKQRQINDPSRHTLSSYGYILMLLHFMTYHKRTGNGLMSPVAPPDGNFHGQPRNTQIPSNQPTPLLPNLLFMDPMWPQHPKGTPYREISSLPEAYIPHPRVENKTVNTYFYQPRTPNDRAVLQMLFPGQDLSLGILLASFFRYYAYEFDYKHYVVSLHSTAAYGLVPREVKAELDGWRNYSAALTIEDPFETFYDVAHVLRGGYYHRIRREFAMAYSKIADAAAGRPAAWNKGDLRTLTGEQLIDWICEPVTTDEA